MPTKTIEETASPAALSEKQKAALQKILNNFDDSKQLANALRERADELEYEPRSYEYCLRESAVSLDMLYTRIKAFARSVGVKR